MVIALYLLILFVAFDIVRLINHFINFLPSKESNYYQTFKTVIFYSIIAIAMIIVGYGHWNAINFKVTRVSIETDKYLGPDKKITIAGVSDIHMGSMVGKKRLARMVDSINSYRPDIIVIAGDLLDEKHAAIFKNDIGSPVRNLKSNYGIYAIPGNHEYIGGIASSENYIKTLPLQWLKDTIVKVTDYVTIIGRDELDAQRMGHNPRKDLSELTKDLSTNTFNILLDHHPYQLHKTSKYPIDLQFSGHTHEGQLWPFSLITHRMYEIDHGYMKINNTNFYVSSGFGTWGPPVRIGTIAEIVILDIYQR
jgi:predicted MPP superfamily phosphohydrolase